VIVPLEMLSFTAKKHLKSSALLEWETASEINLSHFEIQRSLNGRQFETIDQHLPVVNDEGTTTYHYIDLNPGEATLYYRIKSIDRDGSFQYSSIESVKFSDGLEPIQLFPNPVRHGDGINIQTNRNQSSSLKIYNSSGQLISETEVFGGDQFSTADLLTGQYFYVLSGSTFKKSCILIVQ
jgi:hypothetical protein